MAEQKAIGIMSGTSLDGLDLAWCSFKENDNSWDYFIHVAETLPYSLQWENRLRNAPGLTGSQLINFHFEYGDYIGQRINDFVKKNKITDPGIIASHGHTIFHRPDLNYTFQAGNGAAIAARTGLTVVCDFRSLDVALGGQGAPLVPVGDHYLFPQYTYCLNLGGFANISLDDKGTRTAFDICPVNFVINKLIREKSQEANSYANLFPNIPLPLKYDPSGIIAGRGNIETKLLEHLNNLDFYKSTGPKSLGEEWVNDQFWPVIRKYDLPLNNLLRTVYEHIAIQISLQMKKTPGQTLFITGGGAHNDFLIKIIREKIHPLVNVIIPQAEIIEFKEAMLFAFLGILRIQNQPNSLSSATGSHHDNIGGAIYQGKHQ